MDGCLEDSLMRLGEHLLSFMGLVRTSYSHSKMGTRRLFIIGKERMIRCSGEMINQLAWVVELMADSVYISLMIS
jgi:hypothetical protein